MDLHGAVPVDELSKLPSTADQAKAIQDKIAAERPAVEDARKKSDQLAREAANLQRRLIAAAAEVEALETETIRLDGAIAALANENARLTQAFIRDRVPATHLVAVLERLQRNMPPAMVLKSDDVLSAARGSMILSATLPQIYGRAAALAQRIEHLKAVRGALIARRRDAARTGRRLAGARVEMVRLLARKRVQAAAAAFQYGDLKQIFDQATAEATNLDALLKKVAALRTLPSSQGVAAVGAADGPAGIVLFVPVAGTISRGGPDGLGGAAAPGITYSSLAGAQVIAPAEGRVRFADLYQKNGYVLILETATGYDVVLAGLGSLDVRLGDRVLTGEPVGTLPGDEDRPHRLYFELRHNGQGMNPAPFIATGSRKVKRL
jgi:murein hydrolase activator